LVVLAPNADARNRNNGWNNNQSRDYSQPRNDSNNLPPCVDKRGEEMDFNNQQVAQWKTSTKNGYQDRGYVKGTFTRWYSDRNGHVHFQMELTGTDTTLEVIYNTQFGEVDRNIRTGVEVIACGDYITSTKQTRYPVSPDLAIIHWIHKSMNGSHPSGFLMIDGQLYGQEDAPPRGNHNWQRNRGNNDNGNEGDDNN
jgi:hypothetical protein